MMYNDDVDDDNNNLIPQVFVFKSNQKVRTVVIDNEPWFVAKDVCGFHWQR